MNDFEENNKKNKSINKSHLLTASIIFVLIAVFVCIFLYISVISSIEEKISNKFVASDSKICSYVAKECDNATLLNSVYRDEHTQMRICTFRDADRGFTFTAVSKIGPQNQLTVIPFPDAEFKCDYRERFYYWLEPQIKPVLENEGIAVKLKNTDDLSKADEKCYFFEDQLLVTSKEQEESDKQLIIDTLNSFDLPRFYENFDIEVYYLENNNID